MLQPRWIAMLVLALLVSAAFAWLGQWQLERAVVSAETAESPTEDVVALAEVATPNEPLFDRVVGQLVEVDGSWVAGDFVVVTERVNLGQTGAWVVGHLSTGDGGVGWAADVATATETAAALNADTDASVVSITGRLNASQAPEVPDGDDPYEMTTMSVAALVNIWPGFDERPIYNGYIVSADAPAGLTTIDAPAVERETTVNWLNIFYAIEWVVFAGFAIFLWYRLVRDSWEREQEEADARAAENGPVE
ncbi:MAG: SURF1 family cytochrome oxidase biogenesis protein [Mycetocola sp.]